MEISKKIAYLKGLAEGLKLDSSSKEGRLIYAMLDVLEEISAAVYDLEFDVDLINQEMNSVDEDIAYIFHNKNCSTAQSSSDNYIYDEDYEGEFYEVECPACGAEIVLDEEMLDECEMLCPSCGQHLEFDFEGTIEEALEAIE